MVVEVDESNPQGDQSNPHVIEDGCSGLVQEFDQGASTTQNEQGTSTTQNEQGASTAQEPQIICTPQSGEEFPLSNILSQTRSVEANVVVSPVQPSDRNVNNEPIEVPIEAVPVTADNAIDEVPLAVDEGRLEDNATTAAEEANAQIPGNTSGEKQAIKTYSKSKKKARAALALTDKSLCPAPDFMQMDHTLVKAGDLLPRKLLILDVEGLLMYAESFMDKTSKTDGGDVIANGMKMVIRRNGVQALMTRCLELLDVALWSCCSRNTLWDYMFLLFTTEQRNKFLFMWDFNKTLDTKEKWT
ncbi:hypothetical protein R1sor_008983 [Riccia sorocarpa]|uniref:FCP1 homology domain-containing protein n=1 Tax=Riccia sorocarpa TaxID=122646 RepID=A0ABD3H8F5_9MARC